MWSRWPLSAILKGIVWHPQPDDVSSSRRKTCDGSIETLKGGSLRMCAGVGTVKIYRLGVDVLDSFYRELRRGRDHCDGCAFIQHRTATPHECVDRCAPHMCRVWEGSNVTLLSFYSKERHVASRTGSCFDNAAAESLFSTLEHEVLSRHRFKIRKEARQTIVKWVVDFCDCRRRHSSCGMHSPIDYGTTAASRAA